MAMVIATPMAVAHACKASRALLARTSVPMAAAAMAYAPMGIASALLALVGQIVQWRSAALVMAIALPPRHASAVQAGLGQTAPRRWCVPTRHAAVMASVRMVYAHVRLVGVALFVHLLPQSAALAQPAACAIARAGHACVAESLVTAVQPQQPCLPYQAPWPDQPCVARRATQEAPHTASLPVRRVARLWLTIQDHHFATSPTGIGMTTQAHVSARPRGLVSIVSSSTVQDSMRRREFLIAAPTAYALPASASAQLAGARLQALPQDPTPVLTRCAH
mmetsp:Transcript_47999/g.114082  ORF Transcript_47999/g.114082 Transcript_47999/m.114082 type:complete len:278 (-) Transcript_47999:576-1409(-)